MLAVFGFISSLYGLQELLSMFSVACDYQYCRNLSGFNVEEPCLFCRAFLACKDVKAVVSIGCCYNLLSEEGIDKVDSQCGFPVSQGVKSAGFSLGKSLRDLACQVDNYYYYFFKSLS